MKFQNKEISRGLLNLVWRRLNLNEFHKQLRNELIMLPIPKIRQMTEKQGHYLDLAIERVGFHKPSYIIS